jgi:hypothetical protein
VLTQRCDLIRDYRVEPLVELAGAEPVTDRRILDQARSNSPRFVFLAERPDGAWVVDLRRRAWLPKYLLAGQDAVQPLPNVRARKRFRLRIGQRYWRDPVPDDIVSDVQRPLHDALDRSRARVRLGGLFSEWLGIRGGDKVLVLAILGEGKDRREAEAAFDELLAKLKPDVRERLAPESAVVDVDDIAWGLWLDASSSTSTTSPTAGSLPRKTPRPVVEHAPRRSPRPFHNRGQEPAHAANQHRDDALARTQDFGARVGAPHVHGKLPPALVGPAAPVRNPARETAIRERRGVEALDLALARALPVREHHRGRPSPRARTARPRSRAAPSRRSARGPRASRATRADARPGRDSSRQGSAAAHAASAPA